MVFFEISHRTRKTQCRPISFNKNSSNRNIIPKLISDLSFCLIAFDQGWKLNRVLSDRFNIFRRMKFSLLSANILLFMQLFVVCLIQLEPYNNLVLLYYASCFILIKLISSIWTWSMPRQHQDSNCLQLDNVTKDRQCQKVRGEFSDFQRKSAEIVGR